MPVRCSVTVSDAIEGLPVAVNKAPCAFTELAQPWPEEPLFAHGHAVPVPSPKQNGVPVVAGQGVVIENPPAPGGSPGHMPIWNVYALPKTALNVTCEGEPPPQKSSSQASAGPVGQPLPAYAASLLSLLP